MESSTFLTSENEKEQMEALKNTMRVFFSGDLEYSRRFSFYQYDFSEDPDIQKILELFDGYYSLKDLETLRYDIRLTAINEENKLVFMYDLKNTFTPQRQQVMETYPTGLKFGYDVDAWIEKCKEVQAETASAVRNATMASMVDLAMTKQGYKVIRIMYDTFDWTGAGATDKLQQMIIQANKR